MYTDIDRNFVARIYLPTLTLSKLGKQQMATYSFWVSITGELVVDQLTRTECPNVDVLEFAF